MTPNLPFLRATLLGATLLSPALAVAQAVDTRPSPGTTTAPAFQPTMPGAAPSAARPAMPTRASDDQRTSKIVGATVHNDAGASIGSVDDLILGSAGSGITAVLSVGGFLGMGGRLVTVPLSELRYDQAHSRWVLPGASRETLTARPAFAYEPRG